MITRTKNLWKNGSIVCPGLLQGLTHAHSKTRCFSRLTSAAASIDVSTGTRTATMRHRVRQAPAGGGGVYVKGAYREPQIWGSK